MTCFRTLISAEAMLSNLSTPDWVVFDVRHDLAGPAAGRDTYRAGHIPGAIFLHLDEDLSAPKTGTNGRHPLPEREAFALAIAKLGVNESSQVVAYDQQAGMMAARLWWMFRWIGHERVAVLDGGWPAWLSINGPQEHQPPPSRQPGNLRMKQPLVRSVSADDVMENLVSRRRTVIDARAADRFRGENETMDPVVGHIPGAVNRPFRANLTANDTFKDPQILRSEWLAVLDGKQPEHVIAQCGSGVTACHNLLALETAGLPGASLYAGSWSEWCSDPRRPVERS